MALLSNTSLLWIVFFLLRVGRTNCLSSPKPTQQQQNVLSGLTKQDDPSRPKPVKRICIVGAGIAGLSFAHALKADDDDSLEISIFDSRKSLDYTQGSGVQLNGGICCLGKINPKLRKAVIDDAIPISYLRGRNKSWFRKGEIDRLWDYSVDEIIRGDARSREELIDEDGKVMWYAIMRGKLQETLLENLPKTKDIQVSFDKKLTGIIPSVDGTMCQFSDGSSAGPFDLIVGCDGIKSAVKEYIEKGKISENDSLREGNAAALYSGIRINYAVQDQPPNFNDKESMKSPQPLQQIFADGAYAFKGMFGNGKGSPPCQCVFVISLDDEYNGPFKRKVNQEDKKKGISLSENVDWAQDLKGSKEDTREKLLKQIKDAGINDPEADSIVMSADRFFELGVYLHNPFSFSGWSKQIPSSAGSYAVLCGDSAHAMPPFLGQGKE